MSCSQLAWLTSWDLGGDWLNFYVFFQRIIMSSRLILALTINSVFSFAFVNSILSTIIDHLAFASDFSFLTIVIGSTLLLKFPTLICSCYQVVIGSLFLSLEYCSWISKCWIFEFFVLGDLEVTSQFSSFGLILIDDKFLNHMQGLSIEFVKASENFEFFWKENHSFWSLEKEIWSAI